MLRPSTRAATIAALVLLAATPALAAPKTAPWHTDLDEAREEAWARGVPMLIFLSRDT